MKLNLFTLFFILCYSVYLCLVVDLDNHTTISLKSKGGYLVGVFVIQLMLEYCFKNDFIKDVLNILLCFVFYSLLTHEFKRYSLLILSLAVAGQASIEMTLNSAFSLLLFNTIDFIHLTAHLLYPLLLFSSLFIAYFIIFLLLEIKLKCTLSSDDKTTVFLFCAILLILWIVYSLQNIVISDAIYKNALIYSLFFLTFILFLMLFLYYNMLLQNEIKLKHELKTKVMAMQLENNRNVLIIKNQVSKYKHDLKHLLVYIEHLIDIGEIEEARKAVKEYLGQVEKIDPIYCTSNQSLNFVLNLKSKMAKERSIDFNCVIASDNGVCLDDAQFVLLFSNLLDNAIENCSEKGSVTFELVEINDCHRFKISNTVDADIMSNNPNFKSNKQSDGHGYGISSVKSILNSCEGDISFDCDGHRFIVTVLLPKSEFVVTE